MFAINGQQTPEILTKYKISDLPTFIHVLPNMECNAIEIYTREIEELSYSTVLDWMLKRIEGIIKPIRMPPQLESHHGHETSPASSSPENDIALEDDTKKATVID